MRELAVLVLLFAIHVGAAPRESLFMDFEAKELAPVTKSAQRIEFQGSNNRKIAGYYFKNNSADKAIVISPGWSEPALLYTEVIYDLKSTGYDIYIIDHRGQGESERFIDCECSHVDKYTYYVDDFVKFIQAQVLTKNYKKVFVLGHSMGGAIAALATTRIPASIDRLVLTTPLFQVNTGNIPEWLARPAVKLLVFFGYAEKRRPFEVDSTPSFSTNRWTQSEARWNFAKRTADTLAFPKIKYFTNGWLNEIFKMTDEVQSLGKDLLVKPTIILQAEMDAYVVSEEQNRLCEISKDCEVIRIDGSKHSVLLEKDEIREKALEVVMKFFAD